MKRQPLRMPTPSRVMHHVLCVSGVTGVDRRHIYGPSQRRPHVKARWEVWRRLHADGFTATAIARATDHHHTTIMHALGLL